MHPYLKAVHKYLQSRYVCPYWPYGELRCAARCIASLKLLGNAVWQTLFTFIYIYKYIKYKIYIKSGAMFNNFKSLP